MVVIIQLELLDDVQAQVAIDVEIVSSSITFTMLGRIYSLILRAVGG